MNYDGGLYASGKRKLNSPDLARLYGFFSKKAVNAVADQDSGSVYCHQEISNNDKAAKRS